MPDTVHMSQETAPQKGAAMATKAQELGVQVGSIFEESWGYDQTNQDFYEVVEVSPSGKSVVLRAINSSRVSGGGPEGYKVVPVAGAYRENNYSADSRFSGSPFRKVLKSGWMGRVWLTMSSYSGADLWDGKPSYETDSVFGH